jgi:hypothetical protein
MLYFSTDDFTSTGQTEFITSRSLIDKEVIVSHNGIVKRETDDYTVGTDTVTFTYTIPSGHWVSISIIGAGEAFSRNDYTSSGQTEFIASRSMTGKTAIVMHNGIVKRLGSGFDYTISDVTVTFNYTVPEDHWVTIIVLG